MNDREWAGFISETELVFKGDLTDLAARAYRAHLGQLDFDVARAGLSLLVQRGGVHLPTPGELLTAARAVVAEVDPPWCEAWPQIRAALAACHPDADAVADRVDRDVGPRAALFVRSYGAHRLWHEPVNHPEIGGAVVARIGQEYEEHRRHATERTRREAAMEAVERDALAAGRSGLRRLLPGAPALPQGAA